MTTDQDIDDLLRQDEAELKAKRKRLKAFATAIEERAERLRRPHRSRKNSSRQATSPASSLATCSN